MIISLYARAAARLRRRLPDARDDEGSMAMIMLVIIVGVMLSAILVPMVIQQSRTTRFDTTRVQSLDAAQAGIDVALGQIRTAITSGIGDSGKLPCGPYSGSVNTVGAASYNVTISYYVADPVRFPSTPTMICAPGYGTYDTASASFTPSYAQIVSVGTDGPPTGGASIGRTLVTTYVFQTSNTNIPGGLIRIYPSSTASQALCMDAGSATPTAGTSILVQPCSTSSPPAAQQVFVYRNDLTLQLLSSVTTANPNGLCLSYNTPLTSTNPVVLATCAASGATPSYLQQWSYNDNGGYQTSTLLSSTTGTLGTLCMGVASQTAGLAVTFATCTNSAGSTDPVQTWIPSPSVGAGAAKPPQLINYNEFGRCLDVDNQDVNTSHLIDFPCKQNPYAGAVAFNQKFTTPTIATGAASGTGQFYTTTNGTNYCMTSPLTNGGYPVMRVCSSSTAGQTWTFYNGSSTLNYSTKYTVVDSNGLCLGLRAPYGTEAWSSIDVETCTGSTEQKWNAQANFSAPVLQNTQEK